MSSLQEKLERAESAAHISSKHIGVTIALIGALIAFCAAMVTSEQNKLTRTMTEQTQANSDFSGASTNPQCHERARKPPHSIFARKHRCCTGAEEVLSTLSRLQAGARLCQDMGGHVSTSD